MITLRGHHLLCIHGFRGMGYSESFVEEMKKIVTVFRDDLTNPSLEVKIANSLDNVCQGCPNNGKTRCLADDKSENADHHVSQMDQRVMRKLEIQPGRIYTKQELLIKTQEKVAPEDLDQLCEGCSWLAYGVCKEGMVQLRERNLISISNERK
ncbi:DUF1284 domain-containing protein [Tepidibacillus marianensis]|uniref:DUF1284 domain-containing protein n=1 Tax=Tepidibacillus marianensis TaxID=3131995 RepID=UPI0030D2C432